MSGEEKAEVTPEQPSFTQALPELIGRLEKANKESAELLRKHEELIAKRLIGGGTDATPKTEKEETPAEYAKRMTGAK